MSQNKKGGWWRGVERDLASALFDSIHSGSPFIAGVDFDLLNGEILVNIQEKRFSSSEQANLKSITIAAASKLKLNTTIKDVQLKSVRKQ